MWKMFSMFGFKVEYVLHVFGDNPKNKENKVVNIIIIYAKQYIFVCLKQKYLHFQCLCL